VLRDALRARSHAYRTDGRVAFRFQRALRERDELTRNGTRLVAAQISDGRGDLFALNVADIFTHGLHVRRGANRGWRDSIRAYTVTPLQLCDGMHERDNAGLRSGISRDVSYLCSRKRSLRREVNNRALSRAEERKKRARHEKRGRRIDGEHSMPRFDVAVGQRAGHREATSDMYERTESISVLAAYPIAQIRDCGRVGEIASKGKGTVVTRVRKGGGTIARLILTAVDQQ